jgi:hypothetical protein
MSSFLMMIIIIIVITIIFLIIVIVMMMMMIYLSLSHGEMAVTWRQVHRVLRPKQVLWPSAPKIRWSVISSPSFLMVINGD